MPQYIEVSTRRTVDAPTATHPDGRLRPGFTSIVGDGEFVHFDLNMRDGAPSLNTTFFRDTPRASDNWGKSVRDYVRDNRHLLSDRAAVMGSESPQPAINHNDSGYVSPDDASRNMIRLARYGN